MTDDWKNGTNEDMVTSILQSVQLVDNNAKEGAIVRNELRALMLEVLAVKDATIAILKAKDLDSRRCMYCGGVVGNTNEAMLEHIFSCEKRPEKNLLKKAFEVEDGLFAKIKHLMDNEYNPVMCEVCAEIEKDMERYDLGRLEETNGHID